MYKCLYFIFFIILTPIIYSSCGRISEIEVKLGELEDARSKFENILEDLKSKSKSYAEFGEVGFFSNGSGIIEADKIKFDKELVLVGGKIFEEQEKINQMKGQTTIEDIVLKQHVRSHMQFSYRNYELTKLIKNTEAATEKIKVVIDEVDYQQTVDNNNDKILKLLTTTLAEYNPESYKYQESSTTISEEELLLWYSKQFTQDN